MNWGIELWDQFENVDKHCQQGIEFVEKYSKFVKERTAIEQDYASKLRKLVKSYQPKKRHEDRTVYSSYKAFHCQLSELNDIAGQHEIVAENMVARIVTVCNQSCHEMKQEKKKFFQDGRRLQTELDNLERQVEQSKKKFEKEWKESERLQANYERLDADSNATKADVEKAKNISLSKKDTVTSCKTDYGAALVKFNDTQKKHYGEEMPKVFENYRSSDSARVQKLQEWMLEYANVDSSVKPIVQKCLDGMKQAAEAINPELDAGFVVERLKSGFPIPGDKEFEDYTAPKLNSGDDSGTGDSPRNSINSNRNKKGGLSWLFGAKKLSPKTSSEGYISDNSTSDNMSSQTTSKSSTLLSTTSSSHVRTSSQGSSSSTWTSRGRSASFNPPPITAAAGGVGKSEQNINDKLKDSLAMNSKRLKNFFSNKKDVESGRPASCCIVVDHIYAEIADDDEDDVGGGKKVVESPDFSHLPPEQRKKRLQAKINEIRKEIKKEEEGRNGIIRMQEVYKSNPQLGTAAKVQPEIDAANQVIAKLQAELQQHETWYADATGKSPASVPAPSRPVPPKSASKPVTVTTSSDLGAGIPPAPPLPGSNSSIPPPPPLSSNQQSSPPDVAAAVNDEESQEDPSFGDDFDEDPVDPVGTCDALYDYDASSEGEMSMRAGDTFQVLEADSGDGWTRVMSEHGDGYVPTTYIDIKFFY